MTGIRFQYYSSNVYEPTPLGNLDLYEFLQAIKQPKSHIIELFERLRSTTDEAIRNQIKTHLYYFTPAVIVKERRCYDCIDQFTGLMVLDFDKVIDPTELKSAIINEYEWIIAVWLSASGNGVRALVNIPIIQTVEDYKSLFRGIQYRTELGQVKGFDVAPQNPVLPLFMSYDPDILYRSCDTEWDQTYTPPVSAPLEQYKFDGNPDRVARIIRSSINRIVNNGHPQLRAAAFSLGGYVGSGLITPDEAVQLIDHLIATNEYLSQKSKVYMKTARDMILKGQAKPLYLTQ